MLKLVLCRIAIPMTSTKHFASLARRLSRIFAHAYFHHRELFEQAEAENALYERFLGLVQEFQLVPAEYLVINWEDRPSRKSRGDMYQNPNQLGHAYEGGDYEAAAAQPRTILAREGSGSGVTDEAGLMASPSGGALGRRRTDTMYMTGDILAALDPVLSGGVDEAAFDAATKEFIEDSQMAEKAQEDAEAEMAESVDPFKDENEVAPTAEESHSVGSDFEVLGDSDVVPDVEDVVVPASDTKQDPESAETASWPDTEVLDQEAAQAEAEGQSKEDIITEPTPTPVSEEGDTSVKDAEKPAEPEPSEGEAKPEKEKATPEDNDAVEKMLKDLEEERMVKLGFASPTEES
jgi:hypothetical protein